MTPTQPDLFAQPAPEPNRRLVLIAPVAEQPAPSKPPVPETPPARMYRCWCKQMVAQGCDCRCGRRAQKIALLNKWGMV